MEKQAWGRDSESHEQSPIMVGRDIVNNRIVVSLWTIQVVTALFVIISMSFWMALVTGVPTDDVWLGLLGICSLAFLVAALFDECRLYMRHVLTIEIYVGFQVVKASSWAIVLLILLKAFSGVEDAGARVFAEAARKLVLPFLASLLHGIYIYCRDRATGASNSPLPVEDILLAMERLELASPG